MLKCTLSYPTTYPLPLITKKTTSDTSNSNIVVFSQSSNAIHCEVPNNGFAYEQLFRYVKETMDISHPSLQFIDDDGDECRIINESQLIDAYNIWGDKLCIEITLDDKFILQTEAPSPTITAMDSPSLSSFSFSSSTVRNALQLNEDISLIMPRLDDANDLSDDELYSEARVLVEPVVTEEIHESEPTNNSMQQVNFNTVAVPNDEEKSGAAIVEVEDFDLGNEKDDELLANLSDSELNTMESFIDCGRMDASVESPPLRSEEITEHKICSIQRDSSLEMKNADNEEHFRNFNSISFSTYLSSYFNNPDILRTIDEHPDLVQTAITSDESFFTLVQQLNEISPAAANHPCTQVIYAIRRIHVGTTCVHCYQSPIQGSRYHCLECTSDINPVDSLASYDPVDLCSNCYVSGMHTDSHTLTCFDSPSFEVLPNQSQTFSSTSKKDKFSERVAVAGRKLLAEIKEFRLKVGMKVDPVVDEIVNEMKSFIHDLARSVDSIFTSKQDHNVVQSDSGAIEMKDVEAVVDRADEAHDDNVVSDQVPQPPLVVVDDDEEDLQICPQGYIYANELEMIRSMGFICAAADEQTVVELLNASKGNIDQTIQWMTDCIGYGK